MTIKKTVRPVNLPGVHPGLAQRLREAEEAEKQGDVPRSLEGPQKILRPSLEVSTQDRAAQAQTIGLVEPAWREGVDGRLPFATQAPYLPGVDLDGVWDQMSEAQRLRAGATERFRLEMETTLQEAAGPFTVPHEIGGRLDARNLERMEENVRSEIAAYAALLAPDSRDLLERFFDTTRALLGQGLRQKDVAGLDAKPMYEILRDFCNKLIYQELVSRRRAMGDRGIRRICANIELADIVYKKLEGLPTYSLRQRLLMRLIHVHQDLGHTAYAARTSFRGSRLHRAYGARIFTDELNRYRAFFEHQELELARTAVATHSSEELPFKEARVLALVRAIDHLAPFAPYRVWAHLKGVEGAPAILDVMLARLADKDWAALALAQDQLRALLAETDMPPTLRADLLAAFRPFHKLAEPVDLGDLAGELTELRYDLDEAPGMLLALIESDPFARRYQILFDTQQDQLARVARHTKVSPAELRQKSSLVFQVEGFGALALQRVG